MHGLQNIKFCLYSSTPLCVLSNHLVLYNLITIIQCFLSACNLSLAFSYFYGHRFIKRSEYMFFAEVEITSFTTVTTDINVILVCFNP